MRPPPGGADLRRSLVRRAIVAVVATVILAGVLIGTAGAATAPDPGSPSALNDSSGAATSDAIEAAVAHVSEYESKDVPDTTVVVNTTDLVSLVRETTTSDPADIRTATANLSITAPQVVADADGTRTVELYSWTRDQGLLLRWEVSVEAGQVVHHRSTAVRTGVGNPVNFEGFAPPEGATVFDESLALTSHSGGNLSVSTNFVTVREDGSAESTTISVSDFGSGGETVNVTVTIEGTQIKNRSGTPLSFSTDKNGNGSVKFIPPASPYSGRACIRASSPSTTLQWCITDRTPGNDNNTMNDERGLLTIEEARNDTATSAGATITYIVRYTDQNLDSVIDNDPSRSTTESDRQEIVDAALDAVTAANRNQIGSLGFDRYVGQQLDRNSRIPVSINDGQWAFHGVRATKAFGTLWTDGTTSKSMTWNPNTGYGTNATLHARHILAHEHMHLIQYSYQWYGNNNGGKWVTEGMARFIETRADPDVVHDDRSLFFADNGNGVNGYLKNPDRQSIGNFTYDYAIFWLYLSKRGGINAVERALAEINNVSGSGDVDDWAPRALDRAIRRDANLRNQGIDSYREFLLEFHVDVYRATHGENPLPFVTSKGWAEHMDPVDTEDYEELYRPSDPTDSAVDSVGTWGVDYIQYGAGNSRSHDGLYFSLNRSDLYTRTVRLGPNSDRPISFPNSDIARGNLSTGSTDPHIPGPNNTVYHGSMHADVGVVVMSLGRGKKAYNLTARANLTVHRLNNSLNETDEEAIYLIPVNQPKPSGLTGQYGAHGDVFVSVHPSTVPTRSRTGGPRNLTADLTLAAGGSTSPTIKHLPTSERSDKTEFVARIDSSASSVWKLTVTEQSSTPADPGIFFVRSNYLEGGPSDGLPTDQLFGMPTEMNLAPGDLQAGSTATPNQINFVVEVDNGDNRYRHSPFPRPDSSHVLVEIGGVPISPSLMSVTTLGEGRYHVTLTPPGGQFSAGPHRLCVAFTDTKFGVTETTPDNCGEQVAFPSSPPGQGTSITIDPRITTTIDLFPPTPVLKTTVATADDNDTVSLVRLNNSGEGSTTAITTTRVGGAESRSSLKTSIEETTAALDPGSDAYDIAAGLVASLRQLQEADPDAPRATILLSSGHATSSSGSLDDAIERYVDAGIPIHVVAAGENPNTDLLKTIADRTGGTYQRPTSYAEFKAAFRIIDRLNGREEIIRRDAATVGGPGDDTLVRSFDVDETVGPLVVRVDLNGDLAGNASVSLLNPDGEIVGSTATSTSTLELKTTSQHDGIVVFRLENPQPGNWSYNVTGREGVEGDVFASITSHSTTSLRAATGATPRLKPGPYPLGAPGGAPVYTPGETVRIGTSLVGPGGGLDDARVTGVLTLPSGEQRTVEFDHRENGSYVRSLEMSDELTDSVLGTYRLTVTAGQGDVRREQTLAWRVRSPPFVPTATIDDVRIEPGKSTTANLTWIGFPTD
ncbi:MAG: VWA domain-containing protein [Halobacteriales archaeon]